VNPEIAIPRWLVVLTRVQLGASFIFSDHGSGSPGELTGFLRYASEHGFGWYAAFLRAVVIPRSALFGTLVLVAELYAGIAMVLGVTTRLAAAVALFLLVNYLCAKGRMPWIPGIDPSDIVLALIVMITAAGRVLGLDRFLHQRFPAVPLW
jgi:thiosulfate dehydrogenase [quinone] large subunit